MSNINQLFNMLTQNPFQTLSQKGFNIPTNIKEPQDMVQHLLNTGQISQSQVNNAMQLRNNPVFKNLPR